MSGTSFTSRVAATAVCVSALLAAPASSAAEEWAWPVRGSVITPYSNDNSRPYAGGMHRGIDIAAPVGRSVVAAQSGRVTYAGALGSSGLVVAVETAGGRHATSYLHLASVAVRRGAGVRKGEKIGEVGTSGRRSATEPHLHFGVRFAGRERHYIDPLTLLPPLAGRPAPPVAAPPPLPVREQHAPVPVRTRPAPSPAGSRWSPVPAGPLPRPLAIATKHRTKPAARLAAEPAPELPLGLGTLSPAGLGPLVSLAGLLLLGAVLAGRLLRRELAVAEAGRSSVRGQDRAQPPPRTVRPARLGSVSQMG